VNESRQPSEGFDVAHAFAALWRRAPLIIACVAIAALAAFALSRAQPKAYQATASLAFSENPLSQQIAGLPTSANAVSALEQQASDVELVKLGDMAQRTAQLLGHGLSAQSIARGVSVSGQGESGVVAVTARAGSPMLAAAIANTYTQQFVAEQAGANRRYYASALALVRRELRMLSPAQRVGPDGLGLQDRVQTLTLLSELQYGNVTLAAAAVPPTGAASPRTSRNLLIGALLGLLFAVGVVFVLEQLDARIKRAAELEGIYEAPLLGSVPQSPALAAGPDGEAACLPEREADTFGLIGAQLGLAGGGRAPAAILLSAAARGEGASTLARELAAAGARVGSRVLLMRADLREGSAQHAAGVPGLSEVLTGAVSTQTAIRRVVLPGPQGTASSPQSIDVLGAGAGTVNPGGLLASQAMSELLGTVGASYDLVVIDGAPLGEVSDAFPLLARIDGVIVVARLGRARRETAERLAQILTRSGTPLLGVITNGARPRWSARRRASDPGPVGFASPATASSASPAQEELVST
jgi:Mrp family chromosome partitioning ATPase